MLISEFKENKIIQLAEWQGLSLSNSFCEQIILPLKNKLFINEKTSFKNDKLPIQRSFLPGSEWVYFKIYCSNSFSDELLCVEIKPLLENLIDDKIIDQAFFIRYTDPHHHIRFRMHITDIKFFSQVIQKVYEVLNPYFISKNIWNIQLDSYHRELERYGFNDIVITERAFFEDTLLVINLLTKHNFIESENIRLFAAVKNVDSWLSLFNLSLQEKLNFCKTMEDHFLKEFSSELKTHIRSKYRELSNELNSFLISGEFEKEFLVRDENLNSLNLSKENLSSYIHMSLNRWFNSEQRAFELVSYSFAMKYYSRVLSQKKLSI